MRDYDPFAGRFTAKDPAKDLRGDGDLMDYCVDDPVGRIDPSGLSWWDKATKWAGEKVAGAMVDESIKKFIGNRVPEDYKEMTEEAIDTGFKFASYGSYIGIPQYYGFAAGALYGAGNSKKGTEIITNQFGKVNKHLESDPNSMGKRYF